MKKWINKNLKDLTNKSVLIIGSTGVLGQEVCNLLAIFNANLILANRNLELSQNQKTLLLKINPNIKIDIIKLDLENFENVKNACLDLNQLNLDYVILNAGMYKTSRTKTSIGYDKVFQVNFLSQYYICKQITKKQKPKFIIVGSIAHKKVIFNSKDIDFSNNKNPQKIYGNSKRFLMFALYKHFVNNNIKFSIVHPGITPTNITRNYNKFLKIIIKLPMKIMFNSPKKSALCIVSGIFENTNDLQWIGPKHFDIWGMPSKKKLSISLNEIEEIYTTAEKLYSNLLK